MNELFRWPQVASHYASQVDVLAATFAVLVIVLSAPVFVLMLVFALRYRRGRPANRKGRAGGNIWLEASWTLIPFFLIIFFFTWSASLFFQLHRPPADAQVIQVVAKQWMWKFQHPEGAREINDLHVPAGVPIRLQMISQDVIHSLYLPVLRIKQDVLPDRYTSLWFTADRPGVYPLRCAEFCGTDHSEMGGRLIAMRPEDYARWLTQADNDSDLAALGAALFRRLGCSGCHAAGSAVHAPPLAGLYGSVVPLADGRIVRADDQYVHDSIMLPNRDVAAGYRPIMPTFGNIIDEDQVLALEAYIRSLKTAPGGERP
jgi:cytochrome c oxidase subunit 2